MKKILLSIFVFMLMACTSIGGGILLSACDYSTKQAGGGFDNSENEENNESADSENIENGDTVENASSWTMVTFDAGNGSLFDYNYGYFDAGTLICEIEGRSYYLKNSGSAYLAYGYFNGYTGPLVISATKSYVSYYDSYDPGTTHNSSGRIYNNGKTYYYSSSAHHMQGSQINRDTDTWRCYIKLGALSSTIQDSAEEIVLNGYAERYTSRVYNGATTYGNTLPTPDPPSGMKFTGWYTTSSSGGSQVTSSSSIVYSQNITLYARYASVLTVSLNKNGGSNGLNTLYYYGRTFYTDPPCTKPISVLSSNQLPTRSGYAFNGYWTGSSGGTCIIASSGHVNTGSLPPSGIPTLYAQWIRVWTITLDAQNGSGDSDGTTVIYLKYGAGWYSNSTATSTISVITIPKKKGYTFEGYFTGTSGSGQQIINSGGTIQGSSSYVNANDILYAKWKANQYVVNFDAANEINYPYNTAQSGAVKGTYTTKVENNVLIYEYKVTTAGANGPHAGAYNLTIGSQYKWSVDVKCSRNVTLSRIGHELGGVRNNVEVTTSWKTITHTFTATQSQYYSFIFYISSGWKVGDVFSYKNLAVQKTSGIKANNAIGNLTVTYDGTYTNLPTPKRTGYKFDGWYLESSYKTKVTATSKVSTANNHTLYSKWTPNIYKITLNKASGSGGPNEIYLKYNTGWYSNSGATASISSVTKPTRGGYNFGGYFTEQNGKGTKIIDSAGKIVGSKTYIGTETLTDTLYAYWTAKEYTIDINIRSPEGAQDYESGTMSVYVEYTNKTYHNLDDQPEDGTLNKVPYNTDIIISNIKPATGMRLSSVTTDKGKLVDNGDGTYTFTATMTEENASSQWDAIITIRMAWKQYTVNYNANGGQNQGLNYITRTEDLNTTVNGVTVQYNSKTGLTTMHGTATGSYEFLFTQNSTDFSTGTYIIGFDVLNGTLSQTGNGGIHFQFKDTSTRPYTYGESAATLTAPKHYQSQINLKTTNKDNFYVWYNAGQSFNSVQIRFYGYKQNSAVSSQKITYNGLTPVPFATRTGYIFAGWNTKSDGSGDYIGTGNIATMDIVHNSSLTLYAQWKPIEYTVNYNANGGSLKNYNYATRTGNYKTTMNGVDIEFDGETGIVTLDGTMTHNLSIIAYDSSFAAGTYNIGWQVISGNMKRTAGTITFEFYDKNYKEMSPRVVKDFVLDGSSASGQIVVSSEVASKLGLFKIWSWYDDAGYTFNNLKIRFWCYLDSPAISSQKVTYGGHNPLPFATRKGYVFNGWNTRSDGTGTNVGMGNIGTVNTTHASSTTLYAQWKAVNPAKYDEEKELWYVEIGEMPQTRETDEEIISALTEASENGNSFVIAGETLYCYTYGENEYALYNGEFYKVEPVRYYLQGTYSSGDATENASVVAVSSKIVFAGVYSSEYLGVNSGFSNSDLNDGAQSYFSRSEFEVYLDAGIINRAEYEYDKYSPMGTTSETVSNLLGTVSSKEEIAGVHGYIGEDIDAEAEFTDLVKAIIGKQSKYWLRDLGTNLDSAESVNKFGSILETNASTLLGARLTINIRTYACE